MQNAILYKVKNHAVRLVVSCFASFLPLIFRTELEKNLASAAGLFAHCRIHGFGFNPKRVGFSRMVQDGV